MITVALKKALEGTPYVYTPKHRQKEHKIVAIKIIKRRNNFFGFHFMSESLKSIINTIVISC